MNSEITLMLGGLGGAVLGFAAKEIWSLFIHRETVTQAECRERRDRCAGNIQSDLDRGDGYFKDIEAELGNIREVMSVTGLAVLELCKDKGRVCDELKQRITQLARGH